MLAEGLGPVQQRGALLFSSSWVGRFMVFKAKEKEEFVRGWWVIREVGLEGIALLDVSHPLVAGQDLADGHAIVLELAEARAKVELQAQQLHRRPGVLDWVVARNLNLLAKISFGEGLQRKFEGRALVVRVQKRRVDAVGVHQLEGHQIVLQGVANEKGVGIHQGQDLVLPRKGVEIRSYRFLWKGQKMGREAGRVARENCFSGLTWTSFSVVVTFSSISGVIPENSVT